MDFLPCEAFSLENSLAYLLSLHTTVFHHGSNAVFHQLLNRLLLIVYQTNFSKLVLTLLLLVWLIFGDI